MPWSSQLGNGLSAQKSVELRPVFGSQTGLRERCSGVSDSSDISDNRAVLLSQGG